MLKCRSAPGFAPTRLPEEILGSAVDVARLIERMFPDESEYQSNPMSESSWMFLAAPGMAPLKRLDGTVGPAVPVAGFTLSTLLVVEE